MPVKHIFYPDKKSRRLQDGTDTDRKSHFDNG